MTKQPENICLKIQSNHTKILKNSDFITFHHSAGKDT